MVTKTSIKPLVLVNNDRFEGYQTAVELIRDEDLKPIFNRLSQQSKTFAEELRKFVGADEVDSDDTTFSGKVSRVWLEIKSAFSGHSRKAILSSCESGEDSILRSYDDVLNDIEGFPPGSLEIMRRQRSELQKSHDEIKMLRDSSK